MDGRFIIILFIFACLQLENFLADIGGLLGLWVGVSVLTGVEVVELILLLFLHLFSSRKNRVIKNDVSMEEGTLSNNGFRRDSFEMT
jgi:hypothetical protein